MLPPLGIIFGLFVAFVASQVWNDIDRAKAAVNREASALSRWWYFYPPAFRGRTGGAHSRSDAPPYPRNSEL